MNKIEKEQEGKIPAIYLTEEERDKLLHTINTHRNSYPLQADVDAEYESLETKLIAAASQPDNTSTGDMADDQENITPNHKFRVWCLSKNEWEKDLIVLGSDGRLGQVEHRAGGIFLRAVSGSKHIIEFYTGLNDKNGIEIFEGDIVIEKSYPMYLDGLCNYRCVVVRDVIRTGFGMEIYCVSNRVAGRAIPHNIDEYTHLEVIGNIHENPELLQSEQVNG